MRVTEIHLEGTNGNFATARRKRGTAVVEAEVITPAGTARREAPATDEALWDLAVHLADSLEAQPFRPHKAPSYFTALRYLMA